MTKNTVDPRILATLCAAWLEKAADMSDANENDVEEHARLALGLATQEPKLDSVYLFDVGVRFGMTLAAAVISDSFGDPTGAIKAAIETEKAAIQRGYKFNRGEFD